VQVTAASIEARRLGTGTKRTRALGVLTLIGLAWLLVFGLFISPADVVQGDSVRILYLHAPSAWVAYLAFVVTSVSSAAYLWKRTRSITWDRVAGASAEIGVVFMAITLITGSLWGSITWGQYWRWDPRLTTTAFLFITFVGYLAVRRLGGSHEARARRSAVVALLGALEIPLVHYSVKLWKSLHQEASVLQEDAQLDGLMLFSVFVGLIAFTLLYLWLLLHKQRVLALEDALETGGLDAAVAERRTEGAGR
jgi:heme exporter protein C